MSSQREADMPATISSFFVGDGLFKLGFVTNDRERAVERVKEEVGIQKFVRVDEASFQARTADGRTGSVNLRLAVWADDNTIVELIEPVGGLIDIFTRPLGDAPGFKMAFHHVGVLVDDLEGAKEDAARRGIVPALESVGGEVPIAVTYMEIPFLGQYVQHFHRTPASMALLDGIRSGIRSTPRQVAVLSDETAGTIALGELRVRRLGLGGNRITGEGVWGPPADRDEAIRVLRRAVELGINLIDTADSYGPNYSEELIAEALRPYPEDLVIASKGGAICTGAGPSYWSLDGSPEHLREACEGSLRRLGLDRFDLYMLHAPDPQVPYEESIGAIKELQQQGKIREVGVCNVNVDQLAIARGIVDVVAVENRYNLGERDSAEVLAVCQRDGLAFIPWFPLSAGELAKSGGPVAEIAARHEVTPAQVALAWLLAQDQVLPIPGTGRVAHLEENVEAARLELASDEITELQQLIAQS